MSSEQRNPPQDEYRILHEADLRDYLAGPPAVAAQLGGAPASWTISEVGDGNLNLVFIVKGAAGGIAVKQALPYVRLVGESWPLPLKRSFFEYHAMSRQEARAGAGTVPEIYHFDEAQALIVMEYLSPHVILRRALIEGRMPPKIANVGHTSATVSSESLRVLLRLRDFDGRLRINT